MADKPVYTAVGATWRWRWRRWRAAHYVWVADLQYRRWPSGRNAIAYNTAVDYLHRVEASRP